MAEISRTQSVNANMFQEFSAEDVETFIHLTKTDYSPKNAKKNKECEKSR